MTRITKPLFGLTAIAIVFGGLRIVVAQPPVIETSSIEIRQQHEFFEMKVRPILAERCWSCHGVDQAESELRLDSLAAMLEGGARGPAIVPGQPQKSLLILAVNHADTLQMPPKSKLPQGEISDLSQWVKSGAHWPNSADGIPKDLRPRTATPALITDEQREFWSFRPLSRIPSPLIQDPAWAHSPIDMFIRTKLSEHGLRPASAANARILLRRAGFDLLGLPPDVEEVESYLANDVPDRFDRLLDRLLASPRYGERWGRHWLDIARYGDSNGLDENLAYASAFRYRDYVVAAMNKDKPYDRFVREQIAGDLLATAESSVASAGDGTSTSLEDSLEALVATGFLVVGAKMLAEDDPLKMQMDIVDEQVDTIGKAFMGLTLGCARCHDHKFDPLTMSDYYGLAGIFKSTKTMENFSVVARWQERPLASPEETVRLQKLKEQLAEKQRDVDRLVNEANNTLVSEARATVREYVLAAAEQIWLDRVHQSIGATVEKMSVPVVPPGTQVFEAEHYQRGTALKLTTGYGDGIGVILSDGNGKWSAEFDILIPVAGRYQLETRYAAAESRPVQISINGKVVKSDGLKEVTGSWNPDTQKWFVEGQYPLEVGTNVFRFFREEPLPHIDKLLISPLVDQALERVRAEDPNSITDRKAEANLRPAFVSQWRQLLEKTVGDSQSPFVEWRDWQSKLVESRPLPDQAEKHFKLARDLADRLVRVDEKWRAFRMTDDGKSATALTDPEEERFRKLLYDTSPTAPFAIPKNVDEYYAPESKSQIVKARDELKALQDSLPKLPEAMSVSEGTIEDLPIHLRGNHTTLGKEKVPRRFPQVLVDHEQKSMAVERSGRLEFANWLTNSSHPLTSRVMVNRLWQWHFGEGLVRSPDNFGRLGERPTHPELLDWLAVRLTDRAWSLKSLHRDIMLSSTYQMGADYDDAAFQRDPDNRLWWRRQRRRLEAEAIRDSILVAGGSIDLRVGGTLLPMANRQYVTSTANVNPMLYDSPRRSIYLPVIRSALYDVFQAFDFAEPTVLNGRRDNTTVAPQAMFMLNSSLVAQQSRQLASQILRQPEWDSPRRVNRAYLQVYSRTASAAEISRAMEFVQQSILARAAKLPDEPPQEREVRAWQSLCRALIAANEFVYVE